MRECARHIRGPRAGLECEELIAKTQVIARELGGGEHMPCFRTRMAHRFALAHGRRQRLVGRGRLEVALITDEAPVAA